jgi:CRP-like cAMP-binding protein
VTRFARSRLRRRQPCLEVLADRTCDELDRIESLTTTVHVVPGRTLWRPGRSDRQFLVIAAGEATVTVDGVDVASLGPGCGFGAVALLTPRGRRPATVTAATPMTLLVLHRGELAALVQDVPVVARRVQRESTRRLALARPRERRGARAPPVSLGKTTAQTTRKEVDR